MVVLSVVSLLLFFLILTYTVETLQALCMTVLIIQKYLLGLSCGVVEESHNYVCYYTTGGVTTR